MLKQKNIRDSKHLAYIRTLPCMRCSKKPSEAAHVRNGTDGGMGLKPSDCFVVPLCHSCHAFQHQTGEDTFWDMMGGIDVALDKAKELYGRDK